MKINKAQEIAITHDQGPMLVLAGPGSGKTAVITQRLMYLTMKCKIPQEQILVVTFTKAASLEMKTRYLRQIGNSQTKISFGTFHSIFFTILRHAYHFQSQQFLREDQKNVFYLDLI